MHPSSRRVGLTNARNSASRNGSCPSRALSKTTSETASLGSLPSLGAPRLRGRLVPALRLPADFFAARLAIRPGLYSNPGKTPAPRTCRRLRRQRLDNTQAAPKRRSRPTCTNGRLAAIRSHATALLLLLFCYFSFATSLLLLPRRSSAPRSSCQNSKSYSAPTNTSRASLRDKPD